MIAIYVDCVSTHVNSKYFWYCGLGSDVPNKNCLIPASTKKYIRVKWVPFQTKYSVIVGSHMTCLQITWSSFWQGPKFKMTLISSENIIMSISGNLATEQKLLILKFYVNITFLLNNNCCDVACQYSKVPSTWVAIIAFLILVEFGFKAKHDTGEWSIFLNTYWTFPFLLKKNYLWNLTSL